MPMETLVRMELIEVPTGVRSLGAPAGHVVVAHAGTRLSQRLAEREDVVLLDADGEYRAGVVADVVDRDGAVHYVIREGVRLPPEAAAERLEGHTSPLEERGIHSTQSILDLLGELRDRGN